jgi:hypothetical protein
VVIEQRAIQVGEHQAKIISRSVQDGNPH